MQPIGGGARNGILSLTIKDKAVLYAAYMPFVKNGGMFIPTSKSYKLGDEVFATPAISRGEIFARVANLVNAQSLVRKVVEKTEGPLTDEFRDEIKSDIADIKNIGNKLGGATHGAAFVDAVVAKALAKNRDERYSSAREFAVATTERPLSNFLLQFTSWCRPHCASRRRARTSRSAPKAS